MTQPHVLVADWVLQDFDVERELLDRAGVAWSLPSWQPPPPPREEQRRQLLDRIKTASRIDAVLFILAPLDSEAIEALPDTCKLLQRMGTGLDTVDMTCAQQRDIPVQNTPYYCLEEVAVHAMSMFLSLHRQLIATQDVLLSGRWVNVPPAPLERLSALTLGIVGMGRIGQKLAEMAKPFVARVVYHDPVATDAPDWAEPLALEDLYRQSDMVSLHCPLTPENHHMINAETLAMMKRTAILVNVARGGLVDADALAAALDAGRLAGAGLDVYEPEVLPEDSPLRHCRNALLTSHTAWYSRQALLDARTSAIQYILDAIEPLSKETA